MAENTKRDKKDWKTRRAEILAGLDERLQRYVADPAEQAGVGKIGAGVAAGASALADFLTPEDATDAAMTVAGGGALKALSKLRKLKKAKKLRKRDVDLDDPGFGEDISIKDIRKKIKEMDEMPEAPLKRDPWFERAEKQRYREALVDKDEALKKAKDTELTINKARRNRAKKGK